MNKSFEYCKYLISKLTLMVCLALVAIIKKWAFQMVKSGAVEFIFYSLLSAAINNPGTNLSNQP